MPGQEIRRVSSPRVSSQYAVHASVVSSERKKETDNSWYLIFHVSIRVWMEYTKLRCKESESAIV